MADISGIIGITADIGDVDEMNSDEIRQAAREALQDAIEAGDEDIDVMNLLDVTDDEGNLIYSE